MIVQVFTFIHRQKIDISGNISNTPVIENVLQLQHGKK